MGSGFLISTDLGDVEQAGTMLQGAMPASVQGAIARQTTVIDSPRWTLSGLPGAPTPSVQRFLQLRLQSDFDGRVNVIEGRLPTPRPPTSYREVTGMEPAQNRSDTLLVYETAISRATAELLEVRVGDRLIAVADQAYLRASSLRTPPGTYQILIEFVGLIEPVNPADEYWLDDTRLQRPGVFETGDFTLVYATGLLARDDFSRLITDTYPEPWTYQWRYFIDPQRLNHSELAEFEVGVRRLTLIYPQFTVLSTGIGAIISRFNNQRLFAVSILTLAAAGLAATALTVLGVLAALLAERRRAGIALVRSRGASSGQIAVTQTIEGLIFALPAALLGGIVAYAALRPPTAGPSLLAALATAVAAIAIVVVATIQVSGQNLGAVARRQIEAPGHLPQRVAAAPRLVLEVLVLILTGTGLVLLRRRGLLEPGQVVDPYLVAVPILLGIACGIVALRLLPLLARATDRLARRGRGIVGLLTVRRLARPAGAQLATLAVLLAVALTTFATIIQSSIGTALANASWQQVGADYRAVMPVAVAADEAPTLDVGGIAGIEATARGDFYPSVAVTLSALRLGDVTLLAIEPEQYATVVAGTTAGQDLPTAALAMPGSTAPPGSRENPLPVIISSRWISSAVPRPGEFIGLDFGGREISLVVRAVQPGFPGLPDGRPFVIVPFGALRGIERPPTPPTTLLYVRGGEQVAAPLAEAVREQISPAAEGVNPSVLSRRAEYDRARNMPLVAAVSNGFLWGGALMAALALGSVIAAAEQLGRQRAYEQGQLRLLGLHGRGTRVLALLELLPPLAFAALCGTVLGVAMIRILGPAIDLTAFAAPGQSIPLQPNWLTVALLVAAVIGVAAAAGLIVVRLGERAGSGELLREVSR
jgi:putative ABC transport system permease protein